MWGAHTGAPGMLQAGMVLMVFEPFGGVLVG